ncbi:uncharacterized protein LOC107216981 [Neodiprion lecontei]|uniref:Uncharacterized protein LOC107216981 n=1 Tax=Neodiprion lecontei TaxID=441921 RepID=A0ABM3FNY0_NEOLC|nr:uncharacterized protein LOC107216981 [Neodiprion lecontei]
MLKQLGGWKSTNIAQGYVENSMKNREKIYESITYATASTVTDPEPSTSSAKNDCSVKITNPKNSDEPSHAKVDFHTFSDDFEIDDEDLARIDELDEPEIPKSPQVFFRTASNKKILEPRNKQMIKPSHFKKTKPILVFSKNKDHKLPQNPIKIIGTDHCRSEQTSQSISFNPTTDQNPGNIY